MTLCANRHDEPGFWTPCARECGGLCLCGVDVKAEVEASEGEGE